MIVDRAGHTSVDDDDDYEDDVGGFFLDCEDFWGKVIHFPPEHFFLKWGSALAHRFALLGRDQSTVAQ